jgi:hypothetical protein
LHLHHYSSNKSLLLSRKGRRKRRVKRVKKESGTTANHRPVILIMIMKAMQTNQEHHSGNVPVDTATTANHRLIQITKAIKIKIKKINREYHSRTVRVIATK